MKKVDYSLVYTCDETFCPYYSSIFVEENCDYANIIQQIEETIEADGGGGDKRDIKIQIINTEDGYQPFVEPKVIYRKVRNVSKFS